MKHNSLMPPLRWLVIAAVLVAGIALPAAARPAGAETGDAAYTLNAVGGQDSTLTFSHEAHNGITPGDTTVQSVYPLGMEFTLRPESDNGAVEDVILFLRFAHGSGTRVVAEWDATADAWIAHPWTAGGQPAWTEFEFSWRVRDTTGALIDTEPHDTAYFDPDQRWFRMESEYIIVYWFGVGDDNPDRFAQAAANAVAATHQRRVDGFGAPLSYKSVAVIYGSREALDAMYGSGISNPTAGGFTSSQLGMSVQYAPGGSTDGQIQWLQHVITHELTHLYQFDVVGGSTGPNWWTEGQAEWFGYSPRGYDARLINLVTLQDLPTISTEVTRNTIQADGMPYLVYDMGTSFVNWFVSRYGLDAHAQVVGMMRLNTSLYDALEQVTGQPFLDLENAWRATLGAQALELADIDPAAALQAPVAPLAEAGTVLTLPAAPVMVPLYEAPGPRELVNGSCFAGTAITILRVGSLDGADYYEVDCMGMVGWLASGQLASAQ